MFMMKTRKPSSGFASFFAACLVAQAGFSQTSATTSTTPEPRAQLSLADEELLLELNQQFNEAMELFDDPQRQSQSIDFFTQIIETVEQERRLREDVAEPLIDLQHRSLENRASAYFNAGQTQGAADDFRQLLLDNPRYALDAESLSPKIVDFFEDQKKQLIGYIAVTTEPAGARVTVNGNFVGITNFFPLEVHTGIARVEVNLVGYESYVDDQLRIEPGEITTLDLVLNRTSARLPVITDPPGVEIVVDGELAGTTAGTLPPDLRSFMPANLDPTRLSAPFDLAALSLGQHEVELRLDCYEPVKFPFTAEEPRDYTAQIIKLEESIGSVAIDSNPSNARVYLDGELRGNTPLNLPRVCSGEHRLEVKHETGKYVENIQVGKDEALSFECPIRPTLAVLGFVGEDGVPARDLADIRDTISKELQNLQVMNLVFADEEVVQRELAPIGLAAFVPELAAEEIPGDRVQDLSEKLGKALEVEAFLIGYVPAQRLTKDVVFHLLAVGSTKPDLYSVNYLDRESVPAFIAELSAPTPLFGSWAGLTAIDTRLMDGPIVLRVEAEGPAAQAGIQVGDVIRSVGEQTITRSLDVLEAVRAAKPGSSLSVGVTRQGQARSLSLTVGTTPLEVPLGEEGFLYNKAIIDLRHRMVVDASVENLARLNIGLCHIELGDYETALKDYLPRVTLPDAQGISQGTVYYHTAMAYLRLGERAEATRLFQQALGYEGATLQSNDGPRLAPLIQRRLRELGQ
jgi:tetratricopeptide (TPR) repeat protein